MRKYLAIDSDIELTESEAAGWKKILGIVMERVDNMIQGIQKIKTGKMSIAPPPPFGGGVLLLYLNR